jgi:hypothetical protein
METPETPPVNNKPPMVSPKAQFESAILEAQLSLGEVSKNGSFDGPGQYRYTTSEEMIKVARLALHHAGLAVRLTQQSITMHPEAPTLDLTFNLAHAGTGYSEQFCQSYFIHRAGSQAWDKRLASAQTEALNYMLRSLLMAPKSDEQDVAGRRDEVPPPPAPAAAPAATETGHPKPMIADSRAVAAEGSPADWGEAVLVTQVSRKSNPNFEIYEVVLAGGRKLDVFGNRASAHYSSINNGAVMAIFSLAEECCQRQEPVFVQATPNKNPMYSETLVDIRKDTSFQKPDQKPDTEAEALEEIPF